MHTEWKVIATIGGVPYPTDAEFTAFFGVLTGAATRHDASNDLFRVEFRIRIDGDSSIAAVDEGRHLLHEALSHLSRAHPDVQYFRVFRIN